MHGIPCFGIPERTSKRKASWADYLKWWRHCLLICNQAYLESLEDEDVWQPEVVDELEVDRDHGLRGDDGVVQLGQEPLGDPESRLLPQDVEVRAEGDGVLLEWKRWTILSGLGRYFGIALTSNTIQVQNSFKRLETMLVSIRYRAKTNEMIQGQYNKRHIVPYRPSLSQSWPMDWQHESQSEPYHLQIASCGYQVCFCSYNLVHASSVLSFLTERRTWLLLDQSCKNYFWTNSEFILSDWLRKVTRPFYSSLIG